ncbi:hypothetical protein U9M48_044237 [Paspalum notatum var. saurae]|uniref:GTP cyclohydrolase II n=1 Tax=Paspalum notatum var. saurae TaxID=547442 RepID=A0AAQ3XI15_PASNO
MDCVLLSSHLPSHAFVNTRLSQSFRLQQVPGGLNSIAFAVIRKRCLKLRCYAIQGSLNNPFSESNNGPVFQGIDASGASFRTVGAEITQETGDFFVSDAERDPDKPTDGFSSIDQAISALREGKLGSLTTLDISTNQFTGPLPEDLPDNLLSFNASYNDLSGVVPENLRKFPESSFHPGNSKLEYPASSSGSGNSPSGSGGGKPLSTGAKIAIVAVSIVVLVILILIAIFVIAVDDENGDNEGDLVMAATLVNQQSIAFMIRNGSGIISVGMKEEDLARLMIPMMSPITEIEDITAAAATVTVDARVGISTGVSAADRAKTILTLASPDSKPSDLRRPGHIFPLKYRNGGVLKRVGHTEASVDLVALAGFRPVSVLSTVMDPKDGSMAGITVLQQMGMEHDIPIVSIADLIRLVYLKELRIVRGLQVSSLKVWTKYLVWFRYRRKREKLVELIAVSRLPTKWGLFQAYCYQSKLDGTEHVAVVKGDIGDGEGVLVRVHSECLTGDILGSARCDCGNQLDLALQLIEKAGRGVLVYLRGHEGRGIGLGQKLRAYNLQDEGHDTVEANVELGLAVDAREYGIGAQILRDIGVRTMRLMTNNPAKFVGLKGYGLAVVGRVPVMSPITEENQRYLETKRTKMGHVYGSDLPGSLPEEFSDGKDTAADKEDDTQN